jgi:hypothetical protein
MCRNIKRLRHPGHAPTDEELHDAALQFVRKISGFRAPSQANETAFNTAVRDVAAVSRMLFRSLHVRAGAIALAVSVLAAATAAGQERKITRADLPAAVERTVAAQSQGATIRGFTEEKALAVGGLPSARGNRSYAIGDSGRPRREAAGAGAVGVTRGRR